MVRRSNRLAQVLLPLLLGALLGAMGGSPARAASPWTLVGVSDGLLHGAIHCLHPLADGGMLVGTSEGLNRWDGHRWLSYSAGNGLAEGYITALAEAEGTLWAGSWGGGLSVLRGARWERYRSASSPLPGDWISALAAGQDGLWIATYGGGLAHLAGGRWQGFTRANSGLPSDWLTCLLADAQGGLWVGTERAGLAYREATGVWRRYALPTADPWGEEITALAARGDEVWVGTRHGLCILAGDGRWREPPVELAHVAITALAVTPAGAMWVGTERGLIRCQGEQSTTWTARDGLPHNLVSALAVDVQGRVWVGSLGRGLAVEGDLPKPQSTKPPVVLVHGWRGPESDRLEDSEFWPLARWLREDGFPVYYAQGISPKNPLHVNAVHLGEAIAQARQETGAAGVYLIAFSMGGLNARAYLETSLYQGDVLRAFFLGTPHRGEHLWLPFLAWEYLAWTDEPSALELFPLHADLFNRTHANAFGVPYTVIAGDARQAALPTLFRELPPGDGLVSTWSALGPDELNADRRVTGDIHAWAGETMLLDLPSLLFPRTTYAAHIRPYLLGVADAPGAGSPTNPKDYATLTLEPHTALRAGRVLPGETVELAPIPLDTQGRARFYLRWKGEPLEMRLRAPNGQEFAPSTPKDKGETRSEYLELGWADFAGYVLTATVPGPWTVTLHAAPTNKKPSQYVLYASFPSDVRLHVQTDKPWYAPGEWVVITATLQDPAAQATVNRVQVELYSPGRQRVSVALVPARSLGREQVFIGRWRAPEEAGYYLGLVQAVGRRGGWTWERGELVSFGVRGGQGRLSGTYSGEATGEGRLRVNVGVVVREEGDFLCAATLAAGEGPAATVAHLAHLAPGQHTLGLVFPGQAGSAAGPDGPSRLREVILLEVSGAAILLDEARDVPLAVAPAATRRGTTTP